MRALAMVDFAKLVLPAPEEVRLVLTTAVKGPTRAVDLVRDIVTDRRANVFRGLGWLLKLGALRLADPALQASFMSADDAQTELQQKEQTGGTT